MLAKICDKQGSGESNIVMINDKDEAWYMEMYTGHQYAAVKMPEDAVSVYGNEFMLENLEDYDEVITSPNLKSLPEKSGFAAWSDNVWYSFFFNTILRIWIGCQRFLTDIACCCSS